MSDTRLYQLIPTQVIVLPARDVHHYFDYDFGGMPDWLLELYREGTILITNPYILYKDPDTGRLSVCTIDEYLVYEPSSGYVRFVTKEAFEIAFEPIKEEEKDA